MPLGMEVGLGTGHIVLDGDPAPPPMEQGTTAPTFRSMSIADKRSPISAILLSSCGLCTNAGIKLIVIKQYRLIISHHSQ